MPGRPKRIGRPPKPSGEVRRHRVVAFLTRDEHRALVRMARERGVALGQAARELLGEALR
jgi:hypothetical protein